jgi:hypothetical protein
MNKEIFENNMRIIKQSKTNPAKEINYLNDKDFIKWLNNNGLIKWIK